MDDNGSPIVGSFEEALEAILEDALEYPITVRAVYNSRHMETVDYEDQLEEAVKAALLASPANKVCLEST